MIKLLQERNQSSAQKSYSKAEVLNDIYGERTATYCKYGLSESYDTDNFNAKLISLKEKWYAIIPGFYGWLISIEKPYSQKLSFNQLERKQIYRDFIIKMMMQNRNMLS